ncbi:MAG: pyridine nucleotide-disulfide oxidoreductase family protein [Firmicutes bacterium]|nr:pyridine nucleotide-disulfide oxidoreductase family protein [Bacillota bacterium]
MGKKVLIVGGVAGGASAAARLRRLDEEAQIIMFERGQDVSFANCGLPYYIGGVIDKRNKLLVQTPRSLFQRFNIDVRTLSEVTRVFPQEKRVEVKNLATQEVYQEDYDFLVLSPGAKPFVPDIPGIDLANVFTVRNVPDSDRIKQYIETEQPASALVIGGGFIGLEMAENLKERGVAVTIVEMADQVMGPLDFEMAALVHKHLKKNGINLKLKTRVTALEGSSKVERAVLDNGEKLDADMVILGIGVTPENELAKSAGLSIGPTGGILVDEYLRTSDPSIYAVGDAIQVKHFVTGQGALLPLAGPANKQGRLAADNIAGRAARYNGTQGTSIARVLGQVVAVTGANEKTLQKLGIGHLSCYLHPASHATYYPGAEDLAFKLIFTPDEGKILGAQAVGRGGVDKRIDVIATAIRAGMTVYDLQELELCYAPPFSSAKDPVNMAGYVAANIINGDNPPFYWNQIAGLDPDQSVVLDVRTAKEVEAGVIPGAMNIPVDELRDRLSELPKDKDIYVYCRVGLRGYLATRILQQHGYTRVKNLSGGMLTYGPVK